MKTQALILGATCAAAVFLGPSTQASASINSYEFAYTTFWGPKQLIVNGSTILDAVSSGWYSSAGQHYSTNANYIVGNCLPATCDGGDGVTLYNDFFVFDLSGVSGPINSAILSIANPSAADNLDPPFPSNGFGGAPAIYSNWDVSTPIATLIADATGATGIYADLGSGVLYGIRGVDASTNGTQVMISLNGAALAAIQNAEGGEFAIGGTLGVPEPATWVMMLFGVGGVGTVMRSRPRTTTATA